MDPEGLRQADQRASGGKGVRRNLLGDRGLSVHIVSGSDSIGHHVRGSVMHPPTSHRPAILSPGARHFTAGDDPAVRIGPSWLGVDGRRAYSGSSPSGA